MKTRFSTLDLVAILPELEDKLRGARVNQIYDIDNKTYLIRFTKSAPGSELTAAEEDESSSMKMVLLLESGIRMHCTEFAWPKNLTPSGFTMKLRKHLKNKRLEHIRQLGVDRVVDIQFGSGEAAYHIVIELYDRGNIVIADYQWTILNILRPRKVGEDEDVKLMVREKYPLSLAKTKQDYLLPTEEEIVTTLSAAKPNDNLRKIFNPKVLFGAALLEHCFIGVGLPENAKAKDTSPELVSSALKMASALLDTVGQCHCNPGMIIQKEEARLLKDASKDSDGRVISYQEFHPIFFTQHKAKEATASDWSHQELSSFDKAVDVFFSSIEGQKIDSKALQAEKDALKKLENVKRDHEKRLDALATVQAVDEQKASLIEMNSDLVEKALAVMRSAVANQIAWQEIKQLLKEAQVQGDPVACRIKDLMLDRNQFILELNDPYDESQAPEQVNIDMSLSAYANACKYYDRKRVAAKKEQKTVESSGKALKSAEHKTQQTLKEVAIKTSISKARRTYWFEKFFWAISSENNLMIAGRDAQQNELIVKRYMRAGDVYVHADLHGAASVVVKNTYPGTEIPPRTLEEAATMAISYSSAWDAKIVTRSWWVRPEQVSKTAPSGEYLTVGSFMIRGRKNYLPLSQLIMGFGFLFKLDEESTERHTNARKVRFGSIQESGPVEGVYQEVDVECDDSEDEQEAKSAFPDTRVRAVSITEDEDPHKHAFTGDDQVELLEPMEAKVRKQKILQKSKAQAKGSKSSGAVAQVGDAAPQPLSDGVFEQKPGQSLKRGQKSKLKKMKEKYKDQDDDERRLRMALLCSAGNQTAERVSHKGAAKEKKSKKKDRHMQDLSQRIKDLDLKQRAKLDTAGSENVDLINEDENKDGNTRVLETGSNNNAQINDKNTEQTALVSGDVDVISEVVVPGGEGDSDVDEHAGDAEEDAEEDMGEPGAEASAVEGAPMRLLDSLSGCPQPDDNVLFCIPVVGPYSSLASYKFKVKVLPGVNRRGKAAKTALHLFTTDKTCSQREKDVLRATKDLDISRNLPAKIKITASNLVAAYKSKKKGSSS